MTFILPPGEYTVQELSQTGWINTTPTSVAVSVTEGQTFGSMYAKAYTAGHAVGVSGEEVPSILFRLRHRA